MIVLWILWILRHPCQGSSQLLQNYLHHVHQIILSNIQCPHNALHDILIFIQFRIIYNGKEPCEQSIQEWFYLRSTNLRYLCIVWTVHLCGQHLFNSCRRIRVNHHITATQMRNQQWHQRPKLLLRKLIPKYAHKFDGSGFEHGPNLHVGLLQLCQNVLREEIHNVDSLIHLTNTKLRTFCPNCNSQHEVDRHILHLPLILIGSKLTQHLSNVLAANGCRLRLELTAHSPQQFLRAFASRFCI
mmetsp:Transcript_470/g.898  ORF Transcript_470/g.898 Transcript_470/m.898 type:complete len:243 (+) Transcript_470:1174-1902(+)